MNNLIVIIKDAGLKPMHFGAILLGVLLIIMSVANPSDHSWTGGIWGKKDRDYSQDFDLNGLFWESEDLNLQVKGAYCYNDWTPCLTNLYTWEAAQMGCWAIGGRLPTTDELMMLSIANEFEGKPKVSRYSSTRLFRHLTDRVKGFNFRALGKGVIYDNGDVSYTDSRKRGYYWLDDRKYVELNFETKTVTFKSQAEPTVFSCRCVRGSGKSR